MTSSERADAAIHCAEIGESFRRPKQGIRPFMAQREEFSRNARVIVRQKNCLRMITTGLELAVPGIDSLRAAYFGEEGYIDCGSVA